MLWLYQKTKFHYKFNFVSYLWENSFLPLKAKQKKEYYFSCIFCPDAHQIPMLHSSYFDRMQTIRVTDEYQQ